MHILISALSRFSQPSGICRYAANLAKSNLAKCLADIEQISRITLVLGSWQKQDFTEAFQINSEKIQLDFVANLAKCLADIEQVSRITLEIRFSPLLMDNFK